MKKFLSKVLLFLLLFLAFNLATLAFDFLFVGNQELGSYQTSILDKIERLQSIQEPKIILLGNSNVVFGFDSGRIEEATGMPVVNMGLHGGLSNEFIERTLLYGLNEGDIVVACHCVYNDKESGSPEATWSTIELHTDLWKLVPPDFIPDMIRTYPNYFVTSVIRKALGSRWNTPPENTCYSRSAFNEYGDIGVRYDDHMTFTEGSIPIYGIQQKTLDSMNRTNEYVLSKGAVLLVSSYPIPDGEFTPPPEAYHAFEQTLRDGLDCPVISNFNDYRFPYDSFYDGVLHLNFNGVRLRTDQLLRDLAAWGLPVRDLNAED